MTGVTLKIDFETEALQQALARLKRQAETLRPALLVIGEYLRSIPAHAGKPRFPLCRPTSPGVYPRAFGETRF